MKAWPARINCALPGVAVELEICSGVIHEFIELGRAIPRPAGLCRRRPRLKTTLKANFP
jgi:hypothetical protein